MEQLPLRTFIPVTLPGEVVILRAVIEPLAVFGISNLRESRPAENLTRLTAEVFITLALCPVEEWRLGGTLYRVLFPHATENVLRAIESTCNERDIPGRAVEGTGRFTGPTGHVPEVRRAGQGHRVELIVIRTG